MSNLLTRSFSLHEIGLAETQLMAVEKRAGRSDREYLERTEFRTQKGDLVVTIMGTGEVCPAGKEPPVPAKAKKEKAA